MSEAPEKPSTGIKRLEKKKGRLWGFLRRKVPGMVNPLSPGRMAQRIRHLFISSIKTTSSYMRGLVGDSGLRSMFEYQAREFASGWGKWRWSADRIAEQMIRLNFQPLGMKAEYSGDAEVATIVVTKCPLPQKFLEEPEFLVELSFDSELKSPIEDLRVSSHTARGEWPPRSVEACAVCRIVTPRIGEKLGFTWERGLTDHKPPQCFFTIRVSPEK